MCKYKGTENSCIEKGHLTVFFCLKTLFKAGTIMRKVTKRRSKIVLLRQLLLAPCSLMPCGFAVNVLVCEV